MAKHFKSDITFARCVTSRTSPTFQCFLLFTSIDITDIHMNWVSLLPFAAFYVPIFGSTFRVIKIQRGRGNWKGSIEKASHHTSKVLVRTTYLLYKLVIQFKFLNSRDSIRTLVNSYILDDEWNEIKIWGSCP